MITAKGQAKVDDEAVMSEPVAVSEPGSAVTRPLAVPVESCAQCSTPLAADQRYCLQCGAPRAHVSGPIAGAHAGGPEVRPGPPLTPSHASGRGNTLTLLAGIGVLLLAMGVGVLIGRAGAGAGSAKAPPAQVISVGGSAGGVSTPTTAIPTTQAPASQAPKKKEAAKAKASSAPGSSITKPAPPSAAKNLRSGGSGQSYEQKSKNLPNVVGT